MRKESDAIRNETKILAFDVFGTVVDWYGSVSREVRAMVPGVDPGEFALAWRSGYGPAMKRVAAGELEWTTIDRLHRMILDELLVRFGIDTLDEERSRRLNLVWHRLDPWPDSVEGVERLKRRYVVCTLSNGNIALLTHMAKNAGLPWDCILSAEVFRRYKPDPATYLGVARTFDVAPHEVMMVAAHHGDLRAARECGLRCAFIERPLEYGPDGEPDTSRDPEDDFHARNLIELADALHC